VKKVGWSLGLFSAVAVEKVELIVNGKIVYSAKGLRQPGKKFYQGHLVLPDNGWIAVRVYGGKPVWPMMHSLPFAHSAPLWIGAKGSVDVLAAKASAGELLKALAVAEARVLKAYEGSPIPKLRARFTHARSILEKILATGKSNYAAAD
jgi:TolB protein